jgi:hypothetical protein
MDGHRDVDVFSLLEGIRVACKAFLKLNFMMLCLKITCFEKI